MDPRLLQIVKLELFNQLIQMVLLPIVQDQTCKYLQHAKSNGEQQNHSDFSENHQCVKCKRDWNHGWEQNASAFEFDSYSNKLISMLI